MVGNSQPCVLAAYIPPFLSPHPPLNTESGPTSTWGRGREGEGEGEWEEEEEEEEEEEKGE